MDSHIGGHCENDRTYVVKQVRKLSDGEMRTIPDEVAAEAPLTVFVNGIQLVTMLCTPAGLEALAAGFLLSEGLVVRAGDLKSITVDRDAGLAFVELREFDRTSFELAQRRTLTSGCGRGSTFCKAADSRDIGLIESRLQVTPELIGQFMETLHRRSALFRRTGGVHSAGLFSAGGPAIFYEDIGRHNAVDKVLGEAFLRGIGYEDKVLCTSGRISSEMSIKAARCGVPVIASKSAPTDLAIRVADEVGLTLIGFARGNRLNIYSAPERVAL